jgi:hypothetical protein
MAKDKPVIWVGWKQKYFWRDDWTGQISLKRFGKFGCTRRRRGPPGSPHEPTGRAKARAMTGFQICWIDQALWQIAPRCAGAQYPENAVEDTPIVDPRHGAKRPFARKPHATTSER